MQSGPVRALASLIYLEGTEQDVLHGMALDWLAAISGSDSPGCTDLSLGVDLRQLLVDLRKEPGVPAQLTLCRTTLLRLLTKLSERAASLSRLDVDAIAVLTATERILGELDPYPHLLDQS